MIVALAGDEARHQGSVTEALATRAFRRYIRAVIDKIPAVYVVDITVAVIVDPGFAPRLGLVGPKLVAQILVIDPEPIVEHRYGDRVRPRAVTPGQRPGDIIDPPEIARP